MRDPDNTDPKVFIVPDRFAADRLSELFPDARVESLGVNHEVTSHKPGRKRMHVTNADKNRAYRERKRQQQLRLLGAINNRACSVPMISPELAGRMGTDIDQESRDEIANILERKNDFVSQILHGMLWERRTAKEPLDFCSGDDSLGVHLVPQAAIKA